MVARMKIRPNIVRILAVATLTCGVMTGGCGQKAQRNPPLTKVLDTPEKPPEKGFLEKAGDTTWNVVSAPARWVAPQKKKPQPEEPEVIDPPGLIIVRPGGMLTQPPEDEATDVPATVPSHEH
jgi:hypothetical protein